MPTKLEDMKDHEKDIATNSSDEKIAPMAHNAKQRNDESQLSEYYITWLQIQVRKGIIISLEQTNKTVHSNRYLAIFIYLEFVTLYSPYFIILRELLSVLVSTFFNQFIPKAQIRKENYNT